LEGETVGVNRPLWSVVVVDLLAPSLVNACHIERLLLWSDTTRGPFEGDVGYLSTFALVYIHTMLVTIVEMSDV
jgi:hypothetical protein